LALSQKTDRKASDLIRHLIRRRYQEVIGGEQSADTNQGAKNV